jgi:competence CoiA-like predicted nuclease
MKFICKELGERQFSTKDELLLELKNNKEEIIRVKKAEIKETRSSNLPLLDGFKGKVPFPTKEGFFYPIINSTNILDSHNDVHLSSIWNKSAQEQNRKTFYVTDHELKINNVVAYPENVNIQLHQTTFKELGYDLPGKTTILVFEISMDDVVNENFMKIIEQKAQVENSIRMEYVDIVLCINSTDTDFKEEKTEFDRYINEISNKDLAYERGYFFAVKEARIYKEGSAVLFGSNPATHIIYHDQDIEPGKTTQHKAQGPSDDTLKRRRRVILSNY